MTARRPDDGDTLSTLVLLVLVGLAALFLFVIGVTMPGCSAGTDPEVHETFVLSALVDASPRCDVLDTSVGALADVACHACERWYECTLAQPIEMWEPQWCSARRFQREVWDTAACVACLYDTPCSELVHADGSGWTAPELCEHCEACWFCEV